MRSKKEDTKDFFEKLAGVDSEEKEEKESDVEEDEIEDEEESNEEKNDEKEYDDDEKDDLDSLTLKSDLEDTKPDLFDESEGQLTVDVYQTATSFIVESTIAGVKPENIEISLTPEMLTIKGKREKEEKVRDADYLYQECYWGSFSRSIIFPQEIDTDKVSASNKNGVLKITLPKLNKTKSKKVKVKFE